MPELIAEQAVKLWRVSTENLEKFTGGTLKNAPLRTNPRYYYACALPLDTFLRPNTLRLWWLMLRLLGFAFAVIICVGMAPWGVLVGAILCLGWILGSSAPPSKSQWLYPPRQLRNSDADVQLLSAIPLLNAVYCVNCDSITNSTHDYCGVCGSRSVVAVSRMWQQLSLAEAPLKASGYKVSFTADVREIPANGLDECTKLISRLAQLGGDVRDLHIQVNPVSMGDGKVDQGNLEVLKPMSIAGIAAYQHARRAS